jgi:hypothetical protein
MTLPLSQRPHVKGYEYLGNLADHHPWWFVRWPCHVCGALAEADFQGDRLALLRFLGGQKWLCVRCSQYPLPFDWRQIRKPP